jgi:ankyrin repeat protein
MNLDAHSKFDCGFVSALHVCCLYNCINTAHCLIQEGADINIQDCKGNTPLHWAASERNLEFMKVLLEA